MTEYVKQLLTGQYEAALCMLNDCIRACPPEHWDGHVGKYAFWHVVYHTLCFVDLYLTPDEKAFQMRDIHPRGWREFDDEYPSRRFEKQELADYLVVCRQKAIDTIVSETRESLKGPSGHTRRTFSRGELYVYTIRHVQHHTGQLSAYLRRIGPALQDMKVLPWVGSGWREA